MFSGSWKVRINLLLALAVHPADGYQDRHSGFVVSNDGGAHKQVCKWVWICISFSNM